MKKHASIFPQSCLIGFLLIFGTQCALGQTGDPYFVFYDKAVIGILNDSNLVHVPGGGSGTTLQTLRVKDGATESAYFTMPENTMVVNGGLLATTPVFSFAPATEVKNKRKRLGLLRILRIKR